MNLFELLKTNRLTPLLESQGGRFVVDEILGSAFLIAASYKNKKQKFFILVSNLYKAQQLYSVLSSFVDQDKIVLFPNDELIRAEAVAENNELSAQRVYALSMILKGNADIVISNVAASIRFLPNKQIFQDSFFTLKIGDKLNIKTLKNRLVENGYRLVNKIDQSLQFAVRGDIIDIFSINLNNPVRIELFDDEIESIRYFDIANQTSYQKIDQVEILPASDLILDQDDIKKGINKLESKLNQEIENLDLESQQRLTDKIKEICGQLLENNFSHALYKYYSILCSNCCSIFDYVNQYHKIVIDSESVKNENSLLMFESGEYLFDLYENHECLSGLNLYYDLSRLINLEKFTRFESFKKDLNDEEYHLYPLTLSTSKPDDILNIIHSYLNQDYKILVFLNTNEHINALEELLIKDNLPFEKFKGFELPLKSKIAIDFAYLNNGCEFKDEKVVILTSKELFNNKIHSYRYSSKYKEGTILRSYEDLNPGDYVVHEYQGIGRFDELVTLEVDGMHRDFLKITYAKDEILYVPLSQFQLVRKYVGKEGASPKLTKLHSSDWEKTKQKIKEKVNDLANRLYLLYKARSQIKGFGFNADDEFQAQFESECPFELTNDQVKSLNDIKKDMESPYPMDRLLCGDVGFGKTEVAFRAAFKAINSGKQVAILCPTTILARQHYERALQRFASFDIKIALFSRLVPIKKQNEYIEDILLGKIHLVIGTHRLLSKDIVFDNLGLLIVDEEQRFGVEQKERLKELKSNVDVLTLSATPIPRTLQISLVGMRSLSLINTAPSNRMPVQTYVIPYKEGVIKELIERELSRHGQVFYLHNRVSSLYGVAARIQKQIPYAVVGVAHGQMEKEAIEDVMMRFYANEINVLVCTSIIENGIDVPNANMIIVENADMYGLSQLYQIKGRVGRSNRIAYAYLLYNENKILNETASKRLKAIKEFTALGSGYKIAQRDLMIRGAGDILGPDQAGFIDSIGLDMYIKLLNEAVKDKLDGGQLENEASKKEDIVSELDIDAYIPANYAAQSDKIELYQSIQNCHDFEMLANLKIKTRDIYGKLPTPVEYLFIKQEVDILIKDSQVENVQVYSTYIEIILGDLFLNIKGIGNILFEAMIPFISFCKITYLNRIFKIHVNKRKTWLNDLKEILLVLKNIQDGVKK